MSHTHGRKHARCKCRNTIHLWDKSLLTTVTPEKGETNMSQYMWGQSHIACQYMYQMNGPSLYFAEMPGDRSENLSEYDVSGQYSRTNQDPCPEYVRKHVRNHTKQKTLL